MIDEISKEKASKKTPVVKDRIFLKQLRSLSIYGFTIFFNAAISFGTFSLLTHYLNAADYGIINLYNSFTIFLLSFISIGVPFVLNVDYFKMNTTLYKLQFTNALLIPACSCLFFLILSLLFHNTIQRFVKVDFFFAAVIPLSCFILVLSDVMLNHFRNIDKPFIFAGFSIAKNILEISLTILFVVALNYHWQGRLGSNFIALVFSAAILGYLIYKWRLFTGVFDKKILLSILVAGLPFIPERLAIFALGFSDRFFIDHFSSTSNVGLYGAGAQVAIIVNLSILTLNNTFYPSIFKALSEDLINYNKLRKVIGAFIGIAGLVTLCVFISIPFLFQWFIGPDFQTGKIYAYNLTIGLFFWAIYNLFVAFLLNLKKNALIMRISIFGIAISLAGNYFNVKQFGALGATYTSILVYFLMAVVTIYYANKFYGLISNISRR